MNLKMVMFTIVGIVSFQSFAANLVDSDGVDNATFSEPIELINPSESGFIITAGKHSCNVGYGEQRNMPDPSMLLILMKLKDNPNLPINIFCKHGQFSSAYKASLDSTEAYSSNLKIVFEEYGQGRNNHAETLKGFRITEQSYTTTQVDFELIGSEGSVCNRRSYFSSIPLMYPGIRSENVSQELESSQQLVEALFSSKPRILHCSLMTGTMTW